MSEDQPARSQTTGWQPIETAPRDGRELLIRETDGHVVVGAWHQISSEWPMSENDPAFYLRRSGDWDLYDAFAPQEIDGKEWMEIPK